MHIILELQRVVRIRNSWRRIIKSDFPGVTAYLGVYCFIPCRLKRLTLFPLRKNKPVYFPSNHSFNQYL